MLESCHGILDQESTIFLSLSFCKNGQNSMAVYPSQDEDDDPSNSDFIHQEKICISL